MRLTQSILVSASESTRNTQNTSSLENRLLFLNQPFILLVFSGTVLTLYFLAGYSAVRDKLCCLIDHMEKRYTFMSIITTDDYLPGVLVLVDSLKKVGSMYPFHLLLTPDISESVISVLNKYHISYSIISQKIENPTDVSHNHRWFPTYSKLSVFDQTRYKKIVYLDVDMLVLENIDELFIFPHMSATNAGGMLPRKSSWIHMNSGLFVVEPSHSTYVDMMSKIGKIEKLESGGSVDKPKYGSDQDFLNAYYPDWPEQKKIHLDHKYNMLHYYLDEYNALFGYSLEKESSKSVSIIHYASYLKPWNITDTELSKLQKDPQKQLEFRAILMWKDAYNKILS